jgi:hypothetical protein
MPNGIVGWYNGDWQSGIPSPANWYNSAQSYSRIYDDFVVPDGGWTIAGVFAHIDMASTGATQASWEIRSGMSAGNGGTLIASGLSPATQTQTAVVGGGNYVYLLEVDGLSVELGPGTYWLSVAPITANSRPYLCVTKGLNAVGHPPGNDGQAFSSAGPGSFSGALQETGGAGTSGDFSLGVIVSGQPPAAPISPPVPTPVPPPATAWSDDLASLARQMDALETAPFPGIGLSDFNAAAAALSGNVSNLSDAQIRTGIQALVASLEVPHTDVGWPSPSPFRWLPLSFYWFDDGIYVTAAPQQYRSLLGGRVVSVGQLGIDAATARLTALVAHDNDAWSKFLIPSNKLANTDFLFGTGVTNSTDSAEIRAVPWVGPRPDAGPRRLPPLRPVGVDVQAVSPNQFPPMIQAYQGDLPLYRQHPDKNYWAAVIDGGATVYFQYNSCREDPTLASAGFLAQLNQTLAANGVQRLIVDMRNNEGGFASILNPWIEQIKTSRFNQPGRLYVIVGRATFSAAMEATDRFHDGTAAIFVGEPTGGKPQFVYRQGDFGLPYFGIRVSYSGGVETAKDPGPTLVPDIQTGLTFEQYMNGDDPALDAILSIPPPQ